MCVAACGLSSCGTAALAAEAAPNTAPISGDIPRSREADDAARFLAGMPSRAGSAFAQLEQSPIWQDHRRKTDEEWKGAENGFVSGLRAFGETTLKQGIDPTRRVFYPFGGPDALTATSFFPEASDYVLVALEPAGSVPTAAQIEKKDLNLFLGAVRQSMASVLGRSFFVTREMDKEFRGQLTDGLLPPILFLLARTDHQILGLRFIRVDETGRVVPWPAEGLQGTRFPNKGVEIEMLSKGRMQRLFYFSANLADDHLAKNTGFQTFITGLGTVRTLLKATSYMTHHPEFSIIRNDILAQSEEITQDDSGIPYKYFDASVWHVRLFGEYEKPYGSFRWLEQADLRAAYQAKEEPLPFRIGYGFHKAPSNLLMARRISTAQATK